jgi:hypothetical protein
VQDFALVLPKGFAVSLPLNGGDSSTLRQHVDAQVEFNAASEPVYVKIRSSTGAERRIGAETLEVGIVANDDIWRELQRVQRPPCLKCCGVIVK